MAVPLNTLGALEFVPGLAAEKQPAVVQGQPAGASSSGHRFVGWGTRSAGHRRPANHLGGDRAPPNEGGQAARGDGGDCTTDEQAVRAALSDVRRRNRHRRSPARRACDEFRRAMVGVRRDS